MLDKDKNCLLRGKHLDPGIEGIKASHDRRVTPTSLLLEIEAWLWYQSLLQVGLRAQHVGFAVSLWYREPKHCQRNRTKANRKVDRISISNCVELK